MLSNNKLLKRFLIVILFMSATFSVYASPNVVDVTITENVFEEVIYNPLEPTTGLFVDANENRTLYTANGTIFVVNNHPTEAIHNIVLNITNIMHIENLTNSTTRHGYVSELNTASNYAILTIPDLGAGQNATFNYDITPSEVEPPLNFKTQYSASRILAGFPINLSDTVENKMNASYPDDCIHSINIIQNAFNLSSAGNEYNFTFDPASINGDDASNTTFSGDNRTLTWDVLGGACLNRTSPNTTYINYTMLTPPQIYEEKDYNLINATINYQINNTVSRLNLEDLSAILDMDLSFDKTLEELHDGDNATWRINGTLWNPTNITVNLTKVTYWVSVRDSTGTGFTNPSHIDNDTISGDSLINVSTANLYMNESLNPWNSEWFFNYTFSSSPVVWMDMENFIVNDGVQLTNRSVTFGVNGIYIKELYIVADYWLQISRNITRLADNNYSVFIKVMNLGPSPTPSSKVVQVYNFIPNTFNLTSNFSFSSSTWYTTDNASEVLNDPVYNGTMHQFALIPDGNPAGTSLDMWGGASNENNTWTVSYNVTGMGEFNFDDLFLTGVDPLHVEDYGATSAVTVESILGFVSGKTEIFLTGMAAIVGLLLLIL